MLDPEMGDVYYQMWKEAEAEIKRLRAALELIRTTGPARHWDIAEKALAVNA